MFRAAWRDRADAVLAHAWVMALRRVLARYNAAGGPLLAGGLAYSALFAIVPLVLVATGLIGLLVADPVARERVVATIADVIPPLREIVRTVLGEASSAAGTISIVGSIVLMWGASRFVLAFEDAMTRVAGGPRTRSVLERNLYGFGAAFVLVVTIMAGAIVAGIAAFIDEAAAHSQLLVIGVSAQIVLAGLPLLLALGAVVLVYQFAPEVRPSWHATWPPALVVGITLTIFARVFVFVAPRLIGAAAAIGSIATLFAALAWLGLSFQAILMGAAWVADRAGSPPPRSLPSPGLEVAGPTRGR